MTPIWRHSPPLQITNRQPRTCDGGGRGGPRWAVSPSPPFLLRGLFFLREGDRMSTVRDWIDKLSSKIPGYSGYVDREHRRDMDKRHRESLANRLRSVKAPLTDVMKDLSDSGRLFEVTP